MNLQRLKSYINNIQTSSMAKHKALSAYSTLEDTKIIMQSYWHDHDLSRGHVLLDIYGLLQSFFVSIDALYDLSISLTNNKYNININANPILHELKYIRNDVVGHPTNRIYSNGAKGFSKMNTSELTKESFSYETYYYENGHFEIINKSIVIKELISNYSSEEEKLLKELFSFLSVNVVHDKRLSELKKLLTASSIDLEVLQSLRRDFIKDLNLIEDSKHRFLWRVELLKESLNFRSTNSDFEELIIFAQKYQIGKLIEMSLELDNKTGVMPYIKLPYVLKSFYRFTGKNEDEVVPLLKNIHEKTHPFYESNLELLIHLGFPKRVRDIFLELLTNRNEVLAFVIGTLFRNYRKKIS